MEPNIDFLQSLFDGIQATITRMRFENKFNEYQYKSYPWLLRGSEIEESPYKNQTFPIEEVSWDYGSTTSIRYKFSFNVFLRKYVNNIHSNQYKVDLIVDFYQSNKNKNPDLDIYLFMDYTPYYHFDWKLFLFEGKSIRDILQHFEDTFLEIPPIELYKNHGSSIVRMAPIPSRNFNILYNKLKQYHLNKPLRQMAIGMMNHKRLAEGSLSRGLPSDILSLVSDMETWPDFTQNVENLIMDNS